MKNCGRPDIDAERDSVIKNIDRLLNSNETINKQELSEALRNLIDFRMKLAYNRGTESLEVNFGWSNGFKERLKKATEIIET